MLIRNGVDIKVIEEYSILIDFDFQPTIAIALGQKLVSHFSKVHTTHVCCIFICPQSLQLQSHIYLFVQSIA